MKLKPYPAYKDSGVEWLDEIPNGWSVKPLKFISELRLSNIDKHTVEGDPAVLLCNYVDVYKNERIGLDIEFMSATASEEQVKRLSLAVGDVIITKDSEDPRDIGIPAYVAEIRNDLVCGYHLALIRSNSNTSGEFLYWFLKSRYASASFENEACGITRYAIGKYSIGNLDVSIPLPADQISIANFLDRETGKLDSLISKQEQLIDRFNERIIATVMGTLLSTETQYIRLVHVCEVISRPVNQASENAFTRLGVLNRGRGLFKREETDSEDMGDSDFFWVKNGDLVLSGQFAWEGSVAMANDEHEGCVVSHRFPIIKGKAGIVLTEYLLALFMTSHGDFLLNENSRGSAGRNRPLNMSLLLKEKIPIASMAIQNKVANLLRLQKKLKDKASIQIDLLKEHRTALISATVTGKIDVREVA